MYSSMTSIGEVPSGENPSNGSGIVRPYWDHYSCFCNGRWQWMLVMLLTLLEWKQDGRFCRVPMLSRTGCARLRRKVFCYNSCSCLLTRKIGKHCVDVGSALKNNVAQAGLVSDVVLYLPSISRSRCLMTSGQIFSRPPRPNSVNKYILRASL